MASSERIKTSYPGVWYTDRDGARVFYINYRKPGDRRKYEERLGTNKQGWSAAKANAERFKRINGQSKTNAEQRSEKESAKKAEEGRHTIDRLWNLYLESKGDDLKGITTDKNRYELHLEKTFGTKTPKELVPLDLDRLRRKVLKNHSTGTVRNVLELLRRIVNFGVKNHLCPPLNWTIQLPKADPDAEKIEVLTVEEFQRLYEVWDTYPDRHIVHLHQFIAFTGSRPSEPLKLLWRDIDFQRSYFTKRNTKSGKSPTASMNQVIQQILQKQRQLLDTCPKVMKESEFVFPGPTGGQRKLESYSRHFRRIRDQAKLPKGYRPNYCLRDTVASMMLSKGATIPEVAEQLGHTQGSPMTRRYAKFIPAAKQNIANKAQEAMQDLLNAAPSDKEIEGPNERTVLSI
jgi:integrase